MAGKSEQKAAVITRIFDAPRELVWRAWTEPEMMKQWWGPKIFSCPHVEIDLRIGGKWLNCMQASLDEVPDAWKQGLWATGIYKEIVSQEKLVMTDSFSDPDGNVVPATYYGMDEHIALEMLVTITLEDTPEGKTKMRLIHEGLPEGEHTEGASAGWNESFDKLEALVR